MKEQIKIAIIGLGYVGLPLARLFATKYPVVGFDINKQRVAELKKGTDSTLEVSEKLLKAVLLDKNPITSTLNSPPLEGSGGANSSPFGGGREGALFCSSEISDIKDCNHYIVTVPTPVDNKNKPDFTPLIKASETVGKVIKKGDIVIYESTVYPGATEEVCIPIIEKISKLTYNIDFFAGYSPERINPGDKEHTVEKILKVTSGSTP
ncbi:MAG: nucleotide sugar dehydrogenase, partial [Lutibacter sp.]